MKLTSRLGSANHSHIEEHIVQVLRLIKDGSLAFKRNLKPNNYSPALAGFIFLHPILLGSGLTGHLAQSSNDLSGNVGKASRKPGSLQSGGLKYEL